MRIPQVDEHHRTTERPTGWPPPQNPAFTDQVPKKHGHSGHSGHGLLMIACCVPMLLIAVALVATGVLSPRFLFSAIACTVMMALMMRMMMPRPDSDSKNG